MKKTIVFLMAMSLWTFAFAAEKTKENYKQELLDKGWLFGCTPLNWSLTEPQRGGFNYAAIKGNVEIMELEKKAGLEITSCGNSVPAMATIKKQHEVLRYLFDNGYSPNISYSKTPIIFYAIYEKDPEGVKILLEYGADANSSVGPMLVTTRSTNALNYSIKRKNEKIVSYLVEHNADVNKKIHNLTPLNYAIKKNQPEIIKILLKAGAKPDEKTNKLVQKTKNEKIKAIFDK